MKKDVTLLAKQVFIKRIWLSLFILFIFIGVIGSCPSSAQNSSVKYSRGEITIPTYPWKGKDDINPAFRWTSNPMYSPFTTTYPYPIQDNLSKTKVDYVYKTMILENEYLKLTVIPELGGHVHAVYDKLTGENMLYENKVLKPTLIGLRGAWTSGGIEFNTGPQGHTVTCLSPVEAKFIDFEDGSKGIAIGNIEQVYHTQWVVIIRLRPGKNFIEERIRIYNPTNNKHLYYFWNCVAVPNTDSSQLIYPMTLGQDHWGKTFFSWPVHKGKDLSWLKNHDTPTSVFSYRCNQNFYGSYDHAIDRGVIAYANHYELEGKKSWTWGTGEWGRRFQACLTDDGSRYNEIQTGPLPTQADYGVLNPRQTIEWQEWWYPVRGTKGVAYSNKDVTVNILKDQKKKSFTVLLNGTGTWNANVSVEGLGEQRTNISPEKSTSLTFLSTDLKAPLHITVKSGTITLADFTYPLPLPSRTPPEKPRELPSDNTAAGCWLRGMLSVKEGGTHLGRVWFEKAILKDENFAPAMTSLAELEISAGEYESARKHLEKSIKLNPEDGWAFYYMAQANMELGFTDDALEMAYLAARLAESTSPAYSLAGTIWLRNENFSNAIDAFNKSLDYNSQDIATRNLLAYALWKSGDAEAAYHQLLNVQTRDPLDMMSNVIMRMMGKGDKDFFSMIAGHQEEVLDLADFFYRSGLKQEAVQVLKEYYLDVAAKEPNALLYYYYGILANDVKILAQAMEMNPDYVFPNSRPALAILKEAISRQPNDWKARYYLGNMLFERTLKEEAVKLWKEALSINNSYSVLHRNLGLIAWKTDNKYWEAILHYEKALACNPNDITLYLDLATLYIDHVQQYDKAKDLLEKALEKKGSRADMVALLARTYKYLGQFDKSIDLLGADSYSNWEGRGSLYTIYTDAHLGKGEQLFRQGQYEAAYKEFQSSIEYPTNLGLGVTEDPESAKSRYWIGLTLEKLGKKEEALKQWKLAAEQTEKGTEENKKFAKEAKERLSDSK